MSITTDAASVFRDYVTDGVPASLANDPVKADIRDLFADIDTAISDAGFQTGDFKIAMRTSIPTGWVKPNGTIGNAASGATNRANADTVDLFTLWWTEFTGWQLQDNTGANVARGASAAADYAAGKRMPVPDVRDRYPRVWKDDLGGGLSSAVGENMADAFQGHSHTLLHGDLDGTGNTGPMRDDDIGTVNESFTTVAAPVTDGTNGTPRTAAETRPVTTVFRGFFKL